MKIEGSSKSFRKTLLALAVGSAVLSFSAHAADSWVSTNTRAAMQPAAASNVATTQSVASGYTLNVTGSPHIDGGVVTALAPSHPLHVEVSLKLRNPDDLAAFNAAVNQPGNAAFGKFLTPAQFKARFAPTDGQVQKVVAHLKQAGFTNIQVSPNNLMVSADGTATNATNGFNTTMKSFTANGRDFYANDQPAMVPAALGDTVNAVLGLQNVAVKHTLHHVYKPENIVVPGSSATPQATGSITAHNPKDFATIYDAGSVPAATNTAVGIITWGSMTQTIADLKTFTTNAGMATVNTLETRVGTGTYANDNDSNGEWSLDSQDIVGTSGGVKQLIFYTSPNGNSSSSGITDAGITATYNRAVTDNIVKVINVSLGEDETAAEQSGVQSADDAIFQQAVAQGQTFSVSSGDAGVYQWSSDPQSGSPGYVANSAGTVKIDLTHYGVSEPASSPYVIQVGGTTLSTSGTTWTGETVWNEGLAQIGPPTYTNERLWATGGGTSLFETAPAWQKTALGSGTTHRVGPDVSFDAASSSGALIIVDGSTEQVGGTSLASPIFVGVWARIESAANNSIGFPASNFYGAFPTNTGILHDVTSGNNGYQSHGYTATTGFDQATGYGSLDISKLNTYAQANWATGGGGTNVPPVANFSVTTSGLAATFTDSSTDSDGSIASHSWTFGDGGTSTATSPSHTYTAAGTYTVTEKVTDNGGATNTKSSSVTVTSSGGGGGSVLQNGVAVTGLAAATNGKLNYTVVVPSGATNLKIAISGGTGDADLYVKLGSAPTTSSYDCRPYITGNNESCTASAPTAGTYYIMLNGYAAFSGVTLKASWTN